MADIAFDVAEGYYLSPFTAKMILSGAVQSLQFSVNGAPPSISKYIAYDQLNPPNPFIAVTQDGNGNVVYDGGFPKFYNVNAPAAGINASITMEFKATMSGVPAGTNAYYYNAFSDQSVTVAAGDRLVFDMWQNSNDCQVGLDGVTANTTPIATYALRDWGRTEGGIGGGNIKDQNGISIHPGTDLGGRAVNQWYHREFDLTPAAGYTFIRWSLAMEGETPGDFYARYRDVYIVNRSGQIKATLFKDSIKLPGNSSTEAGASGYTNLVKSLYDPRGQLSASFKYLYNAILWTANPKKLAAGNRKILILGDANAAESYSVNSTVGDGFRTSLQRLCDAVGFTCTFNVRSDYAGGYLDPSAAILETYACVLLLSSVFSTTSYITDAAVQNLMDFREAGNGIIMITDHGSVINDIGSAYPVANGAFFATANKLAVKFGTWFSGNYDRQPVGVGFLRSTYGDHPLYNGMANTESINAGASESRVQVVSYPSYTPGNVPNFNVPVGKTVIQVAARLADASVVSFRIIYYVLSMKIQITNGTVTVDNGQTLDAGAKNQSLIKALLTGVYLPDSASGVVYKNGTRVGALTYTSAGGVVQTWDGAGEGAVKVTNGDEFSVALTVPVNLTTKIKIKRFQPSIVGKRNLADAINILMDYNRALHPIKAVKGLIEEIATTVPWLGLKQVLNCPINLKLMSDYFLDQGIASVVLANAMTKPYTTGRPWAASGGFALWRPQNPVTLKEIDFGYFCCSPVYGSESVPGNYQLDYYCNVYLAAGTYRVFSQADDQFDLYLDGNLMIHSGAQNTSDITITESKYYAAKVTNINVPANTPSYWTCAVIDKVTGNTVLGCTPGLWKTQEFSMS